LSEVCARAVPSWSPPRGWSGHRPALRGGPARPSTLLISSPDGALTYMTDTTTPHTALNHTGGADEHMDATDATTKYAIDRGNGEGSVVKVDHDEVLLDIGYKTEGVIPSRELSIKHDVDPGEVVEVGDEIEALVLQKEDKEGRLILSKKRAQYERAWGTIE